MTKSKEVPPGTMVIMAGTVRILVCLFLRAILQTNGKMGCSSNGGQWEDKSAHNFSIKVSFITKNRMFGLAHESKHNGIARIFVGHE